MNSKAQTPLWGEYTLLLLLILLAAGLRIFKLGDWSYYIDEFHTWDVTINLPAITLDSLFSPNTRLSFYLLTKWSLSVFGENAIALRIFPCIFGVLTIPFVYFPIKTLFDKHMAFTSAFLVAISTWHIYMSQMARWYTLLLLVSFLALISFYIFIEFRKKIYFIFYILLSWFAVTLHLTGFFIPMIATSYLVLLLVLFQFRNQAENNNKRILFILILHVILCLAFIPKFSSFIEIWADLEDQVGSWENKLSLKALYHLTPSVVVSAIVGVWLLLTFRDRLGLFLAVYGILPFIILGLFSLLNFNASARYLLVTLPIAAIGSGFTITYIRNLIFKNKNLFFCWMLMIVALPSLQTAYLYFTSENGYRQGTREAFQYIKGRMAEDDQLFLAGVYPPYEQKFYAESWIRVENIDIHDGQLITTSSPENLDLRKRTWVITRGRAPENPEGFRKWIAENTRLLVEFPARRGAQDQTIKVHLYTP